MCGNDKDKLNIHHNCYDHKGYEEYYPEDLVCLCEKCHNKYHSYDKIVEENEKLKEKNSDLLFDNQILTFDCSTMNYLNDMWEQDDRTKNLLEIIDELKEERDYIQWKFDMWRENRNKDNIDFEIKINNDDLPF